jgi:Prokaryotic E2 family E
LLPSRLAKEVDELKAQHEIELVEEPSLVDLIVREFATSALYNRPSTSVLIRIPRIYPDAGPDMFWTDPALLLADGSIPQAGNLIETYVGRSWRRFSWHHGPWSPNVNNLRTYFEFIHRRFNAK